MVNWNAITKPKKGMGNLGGCVDRNHNITLLGKSV